MSSASRPAALSRDAIVARALLLADQEGLAAVSMRRLGAELGYSGMSLYGYVSGKDELLVLLVDHVFGTIPEIDTTDPWRHGVIEFFVRLRAALLAHPAVARIAAEHPAQGGHARRHTRAVLAALRRGGLSRRAAAEAMIALSCYTLGGALYSASRVTLTDPDWSDLGVEPERPDGRPAAEEPLTDRAGPAQFFSGLEHLLRGYTTAAD